MDPSIDRISGLYLTFRLFPDTSSNAILGVKLTPDPLIGSNPVALGLLFTYNPDELAINPTKLELFGFILIIDVFVFDKSMMMLDV